MRHLWSLLAGVVAAPLAWLLLAAGQHRSQQLVAGWMADREFSTGPLAGPVAYLAVAGIMLGLIGTLRWSPLGPLAAGILLVTPTVLMFVNPLRTMDGFFHADQPRQMLWLRFEPWLPVENGTLLVLGALLVMAVFSLQRWRTWPAPPTPIPTATDQDVVNGITALTSTSQPSDSSSTPSASPMSDEEILAAAAAFERTESGAGPSPALPPPGTLEPGSGTPSDPDIPPEPDHR